MCCQPITKRPRNHSHGVQRSRDEQESNASPDACPAPRRAASSSSSTAVPALRCPDFRPRDGAFYESAERTNPALVLSLGVGRERQRRAHAGRWSAGTPGGNHQPMRTLLRAGRAGFLVLAVWLALTLVAPASASASHVRTDHPGWTTASVNLRSGPSTAYRVLEVLPARTKVAVLSRASGTHWYRVSLASAPTRVGYVSGAYLAGAARYIFPVQPSGSASYGPCHHDYPATDVFAPVGLQFVAVTSGTVDVVSRTDHWDPRVDDRPRAAASRSRSSGPTASATTARTCRPSRAASRPACGCVPGSCWGSPAAAATRGARRRTRTSASPARRPRTTGRGAADTSHPHASSTPGLRGGSRRLT